MIRLGEKIVEAVRTSTVGRVTSGPNAGLAYFARKVLPGLCPELSIVTHRVYKEHDMSKQLQSLLVSILGVRAIKADWRLHLNAEVARQIVFALHERKIDLLVIDQFELAVDGFEQVIESIRIELRESDAACGIVLLSKRLPNPQTIMSLPTETQFEATSFGFNLKVEKLTRKEIKSLVVAWMPWDADLATRIHTKGGEIEQAVERLYVFTRAQFDLVEDFVECMNACSPMVPFSLEIVNLVIAWKQDEAIAKAA